MQDLELLRSVKKTVTMPLVGEDGNAFAIMGRFRQAARNQGWSSNEIQAVLSECKKGDYNHLICVMAEFTRDPSIYNEDDDDDDDETMFEGHPFFGRK